jgi:chaperonin GroES
MAGYVIIKPQKIEEVTKSGIITPGAGKEAPERGEIVSLHDADADDLAVGDMVVFRKFAHDEIKLKTGILYAVQYADILCVIE